MRKEDHSQLPLRVEPKNVTKEAGRFDERLRLIEYLHLLCHSARGILLCAVRHGAQSPWDPVKGLWIL